jgi:hypothetical protein
MQPQAIARLLTSSEGKFVTNRTIYNTKQAQRAEKRAGNTPIEYLLRCLKESNWKHEDVYDTDGKLLYLWFAHPGSLLLARRFHHVVNIDCTYKTNLNNYPLLHVVGQTATNHSFSIGFCLMRNEKNEAYSWALDKLK